MSKPTALDLYHTYYNVKEMLDDLREDCHERGEFGAAGALESACYYLFGAAGWLVTDLNDEEREELEGILNAEDAIAEVQ